MYPVAGDPYAQWLAQGGAAAVGPVSGMAGVFRDWVSQPRDFSMEAMLSGPRGPLVDWVKSQHPMTQAALATAPIPVVGDLAGLAADARMYASEPESRTLGNAGLSMLGLLPFVPGMTAFHGTPHRFAPEPDAPLGKFRLDKIGTGEGAQAYGHGIYLAESPDVAGSYKATAGARAARFEQRLSPNAEFAADFLEQGYSETQVLDMFAKSGRSDFDGAMKAIEEAKAAGAAPGSLYTVDLPDEQIEKMLDWDKPLSEQPESVRKAAAALGIDESVFPQWTGQQLYEGEVRAMTDFDQVPKGEARKMMSEKLRGLGVPGIRYLDGNSRSVKDGTRNFVLFDTEIAKIIDRK